ncbi:MAG: hypothetical protein DMD91_19815 [Candidatus Rokuibacteriota bacterium]|nr:MAG: hypothetical protein DMD91_19815 [Candidatus Rokubacteria bacterium]
MLSPVYRDFVTGERNRWRGTSPADFLGPMAYDARVLRDFSWGAWFWNPDKALGFPRMQDLGTRPLYPVDLALAAALPVESAWAWHFYLHAALKIVGLVLLAEALGCPLWLNVLATAAAMAAEASLAHFGDATYIGSAAWLPLMLWLTLRAARRDGFTGWDAAWSVAAALWALAFHPQYGLYYGVLVLAVMLWAERGALRRRLPALVLRHVAAGLLVAPWLLPAALHYAESGRRHVLAFEDWPFRVAYTWWTYKMKWPQFLNAAFYPWVAALAIAAGAVVAGLRASRLWAPFGAYFVFGLFHAVPYLALPMWLSGVALLPFRIPERVFEPFTWLGPFLLADLVTSAGGRRRLVLAALMVVVLGACLLQTTADPRSAYLQPPFTRPLPTRLAALVRAEPRAPAVFVTGPDRSADSEQPRLNSNHNLVLGIPGAHFLGEMPNLYFARATYRVPGLLFMQRLATPLADWDDVVDVYAELGVGWVFWDGAGEPVHPRLAFVGDEHGFRLYRIRDARPTIYALDRVRRVPAPTATADVAALVFSLPALGPFCYDCPVDAAVTPARDVRLRPTWRPGAVDVEVDAARGTFVVLGETRSRGWRATLDGAPVTIHAVNELFQAVAVPPGRHVIAWRFASPGFFVGLALVPLGVGLLIAALRWSARGRATNAP